MIIRPAPHPFHGFRTYLLAPEHELEEALPEEFLEAREVDVVHGVVEAVATKDAEGNDRVEVRMNDQKVPEGLRNTDHRRHCFFLAGKPAGTLSEVVAGGAVGGAREITVE